MAPPGTVLVAESPRDAVASTFFEWTPAGTRHLKGVKGHVKLVEVSLSGRAYRPGVFRCIGT